MDGFWAELWGDWVGRTIVVLMVAVLVSLGGIIAYGVTHPDPPGTTYTYEQSIQCVPVVTGKTTSIICTPIQIAVPHYPTATP